MKTFKEEIENSGMSFTEGGSYEAREDRIIPKRYNHDHFWVEDEVLFETYRTIRGLRYNEILKVPDIPNTDKCDDVMIEYLSKEFYQ